MPRQSNVYPRIKLNINGELSTHSSFVTKRKIAALYSRLTDKVGIYSGSFSIQYTPEFSNSFDFTDKEDFLYKLEPCIEKELMDEFTQKQEG